MALNYAAQFNVRKPKEACPQSQAIPGSTQVANSGGGFSWQVTPWQKLERFLILGAEGGTYYVGEKDLVKQCCGAVLACLKENGQHVVKMVVDVSTSGRAYKNDPAVFVLALATCHGDQETKQAAYAAVTRVCRIGTHLFHFAEYVNAMRGWGRGLRDAVARWYAKPADKLAYQAVKYQARDGWSHADLLRLAHPKADDARQEAVFRWMLKGMDAFLTSGPHTVKRKVKGVLVEKTYADGPGLEFLPEAIAAFEDAKKADEKALVKLITEHDLPREAIPTERLNSAKVWEALLENMPMTAMIRNLGKMTSIGLIGPLSRAQKLVVERLGDKERLKNGRVHPMQVLLALKTYAAGHGFKGALTWRPQAQVVDALDKAFYATFGNVVPCNKPVLLALDVSGSMDGTMIAGTNLSAREGAAAMALITAATEPQYELIAFAAASLGLGGRWGGGESGIVPLTISPRMSLADVITKMKLIPMGGTDCSLPFTWARKNKVNVAGFVTYTDSETWAGAIHPAQALRQYRNDFVEDARGIVVGMTAGSFTVADPTDRWMLDIVGFDANVPGIISDFIRGGALPVSASEDEAM